MIQYLIIVLDDSAPSFCSYQNRANRKLIEYDKLKQGLFYAIKNNLSIQIVFPSYQLPPQYLELLVDYQYTSMSNNDSDVIIVGSINELINIVSETKEKSIFIVRNTITNFIDNIDGLCEILPQIGRVGFAHTDIASFNGIIESNYRSALEKLSDKVSECIRSNNPIQVDKITDRILLNEMNNCGAGDTSITLAPDGKFYICPAFYYTGKTPIGDTQIGVHILNKYLFNLSSAPICTLCDCYQCKRCVYLNEELTLEVNTPSKQQCVISHIERGASKYVLDNKLSDIFSDVDISELEYLDPFEIILKKH